MAECNYHNVMWKLLTRFFPSLPFFSFLSIFSFFLFFFCVFVCFFFTALVSFLGWFISLKTAIQGPDNFLWHKTVVKKNDWLWNDKHRIYLESRCCWWIFVFISRKSRELDDGEWGRIDPNKIACLSINCRLWLNGR